MGRKNKTNKVMPKNDKKNLRLAEVLGSYPGKNNLELLINT